MLIYIDVYLTITCRLIQRKCTRGMTIRLNMSAEQLSSVIESTHYYDVYVADRKSYPPVRIGAYLSCTHDNFKIADQMT